MKWLNEESRKPAGILGMLDKTSQSQFSCRSDREKGYEEWIVGSCTQVYVPYLQATLDLIGLAFVLIVSLYCIIFVML